MTATLDLPTDLPTPHLYPKGVAKGLDVAAVRVLAEHYADAHNVVTVAERYSDKSVRLVPFTRPEGAEAYASVALVPDEATNAGRGRKDRAPVHLVTVSPEPVPHVDDWVTVHGANDSTGARVSNVTATGISVRQAAGQKAVSYKKVGRGRYVRGSVVVTVNPDQG